MAKLEPLENVAASTASASAVSAAASVSMRRALVVGGARLELLPQRAAWIAEARTLLVADVHIGKAHSFRRWGVPVPGGTTAETLAALDAAIAATMSARVVFLGDFLHSARGRSAAAFDALARWRERHRDVAMTLVRGNHDDRAGDPPPSLAIEAVDEPLALGGLRLAHHPRSHEEGYVIAGHLHPCAHVAGRANDRLRLPCFHFGERVGVMPAFGAFTGMMPMQRAAGDRVFVIAGDAVYELP